MSGDIDVQFLGVPEAMADFLRWAEQLAPAVSRGTEPLAARLSSDVRGAVPHVTGQLEGSVGPWLDDESVGVEMGEGVPYAGWIEFGGTRGRPYIPDGRYLFPTVAAAFDDYERMAAQAAEDSVTRFSWSTPTV